MWQPAYVFGILVVWPSIRLGFRIKRAIFCGGRDLRHPFFDKAGELQWKGFATAKVYDEPDSYGLACSAS